MPSGNSGQKVLVVPAFYKMQLQTDGTTTATYIDLDLPSVTDLGPYLESVTAHTMTENKTANFTWRMVFYWSMDGRQWNPATPIDLFSGIAANGSVIQTAYTTTTNFGVKLRFAIAVVNASGAAIERAVCSKIGRAHV